MKAAPSPLPVRKNALPRLWPADISHEEVISRLKRMCSYRERAMDMGLPHQVADVGYVSQRLVEAGIPAKQHPKLIKMVILDAVIPHKVTRTWIPIVGKDCVTDPEDGVTAEDAQDEGATEDDMPLVTEVTPESVTEGGPLHTTYRASKSLKKPSVD